MAEMMKPGGMPTEGKKALSVEQDIKPLVEEIQAMMSGGGEPSPGMSPGPNEAGSTAGAGEMASSGDAQMVADVLGVSTEKAQQLLDAAKMMPRLADKSAAEIADMLSKDMNLRMQLEKNLGAGEDMKTKETMGAGGPPPMEPTAA